MFHIRLPKNWEFTSFIGTGWDWNDSPGYISVNYEAGFGVNYIVADFFCIGMSGAFYGYGNKKWGGSGGFNLLFRL